MKETKEFTKLTTLLYSAVREDAKDSSEAVAAAVIFLKIVTSFDIALDREVSSAVTLDDIDEVVDAAFDLAFENAFVTFDKNGVSSLA